MQKNALFNIKLHLLNTKWNKKIKITVLSTFLFLLLCLPQIIHAENEGVTLSLNDVSLKEALREIEQQTGYVLFYNESAIDVNQAVSIQVADKDIKQVLNILLMDYDYVIENRKIVITPKVKTATERTITGIILDEFGEPVIGANIMLKGTSVGTISDLDGYFSLTIPDKATLVISYIGYDSKEVVVRGESSLTIRLENSARDLDEVVVVGYGTQKKINLTGALETVKSERIVSKPVNNLVEALSGEAAGLTIVQPSGEPGSSTSQPTRIRIRGVGTWGNASPLVLVDGVAMDINNVMSTDVESVTVLKDAASAAIYGSRAANGVILITTKQGRKDKLSVTYSGNIGVQNPTRFPKMATSWQYAELFNQSMANEGNHSSLFPADRIERMKAGGDPDKLEGSTDWFKELLHSAVQHSHNVTIQGGGKYTSYVGSLGYSMQNGVIFSSYDRYNARLNTMTEFNKWFKLGFNLAYINDIKSQSSAGATAAYYKVPRALPYLPVKFSDGTWSFLSAPTNPVRMASDEYGMQHRKGNKISVLLTPEITITDELNIKGIFGYESNTFTDKKFEKTVYYEAFEPAGQSGNMFVPRNKQTDKWEQYNNLTASVTANYEKTFRSHYLKLLAGGSLETFKYAFTTASRNDFPNNDFSEINAGDPNTAYAEGNSTYASLASLFGRVNYSYRDRYLFEANVRYDGSSKFAQGNRWGVFPSFSLGWRITEEAFFESLKSTVQNLKVRGSWGQLGNQQIDNYQSLSTIAGGDAYMFGNSIASSYKENLMGNPLITWETATNVNVGLDLTTLDGRFSATVDWYRRLTKDILLKLDAPALLGIKPSMQNAGKVENKGWEITLNWRDRIGENITYHVGFNLSDVKNQVKDLNGYKSPTSELTTRIEGQPMDALYGWKTIGICETQEQYEKYKDLMTTYNVNWGIGDLIIEDRNDDGKIDSEDKTVIGNQIPRFCYGLNLGLEYRNFDFSCFFQGVGKVNGFLGRDIIEPLGIMTAFEEHYTDSFDPENPKSGAYYPRMLNSSRHNYANFSHWVQNGAYLRLKNIQLGYTFKLANCGIERVRLTVSGQNLFTITKFRVYDPESALNNVSFPNLSVYSFGVNVTF